MKQRGLLLVALTLSVDGDQLKKVALGHDKHCKENKMVGQGGEWWAVIEEGTFAQRSH